MLDAAQLEPLSVPGGFQSKSLNLGSGNLGGAKFKNQGFKIDSRVKSQLKRSFGTSKTPPTSALDKAYKNLKSDITKLRRAQYVYNTGLDRCLGKTYSEKEKKEVSCETKQQQICARDLVSSCMRKIWSDYTKAENGVIRSAKSVGEETSKYVRERNVSITRKPNADSFRTGSRRTLSRSPDRLW